MDLEEKVLNLIKSRKEGIFQNELWKTAKIDSRKCSSIVANLEEKGLISREPVANNKRTFLIKYIQKKDKIKNFAVLLVGQKFSPCTGCVQECIPEQCIDLSDWVECFID